MHARACQSVRSLARACICRVAPAGEEAIVVGSAAGLDPRDMVFSQYREHGVLLWRGFSFDDFANQVSCVWALCLRACVRACSACIEAATWLCCCWRVVHGVGAGNTH
jgi:TPP-dependent pyruvate/acetoin dehydrogenase alpha subunit